MVNPLRLRLTLVYGALFALSGAVLLAITYLLVRRSKPLMFVNGDVNGALRTYAERQQEVILDNLLLQSVIALTLMTVISFVLGWLVAGRMLRPLRTMNTAIRRISARNVHERLALSGPRDELRNLADTVDGLLERLHGALDAQKRFVANAAHELRTPLTLEHALLEESLMHGDTSSMRSVMERLLELSEQQGRLLESLLTLAESEGGLDHRAPLDLAEIAERLVQTGPLWVTALAHAPTAGDPALVERLIANLLDNAVRYNVPGGRVEISTRVHGDQAVLSIANTGPVIAPEQVDRLFEPFQRLDRTRVDDHHGLGLSIVRAIAIAHDATITADARPQGGLLIEINFPFARPR